MILSLSDDAAVREVVDRLCRLDLSGRLVIDTSTVSPETLRGLLPSIAKAGGSALDAPIAGGPDMVAAGTIGFYVGGSDVDVARFAPVAARMSNRLVHVGEVGAGSAAKIVNNMMLAGYWQTLKEALLVGKRSGLGLETMMGLLAKSPSANPLMQHRLPVILGESDTVGFPVASVVDDIALYLETARALGVEAPVTAAALASFTAFRDAGHGGDDFGAMVREAFRSG